MSREYLEQKIERLEKQVGYLERRIATLEQANRMQHPFQPMQPFMPYPVGPIEAQCSVCGLKMTGPMGYVCNNPSCPSGVSYCQTEN